MSLFDDIKTITNDWRRDKFIHFLNIIGIYEAGVKLSYVSKERLRGIILYYLWDTKSEDVYKLLENYDQPNINDLDEITIRKAYLSLLTINDNIIVNIGFGNNLIRNEAVKSLIYPVTYNYTSAIVKITNISDYTITILLLEDINGYVSNYGNYTLVKGREFILTALPDYSKYIGYYDVLKYEGVEDNKVDKYTKINSVINIIFDVDEFIHDVDLAEFTTRLLEYDIKDPSKIISSYIV